MAHAVQKVVQRCEDCENNGGSMGKNFIIYPSFCAIKKVPVVKSNFCDL